VTEKGVLDSAQGDRKRSCHAELVSASYSAVFLFLTLEDKDFINFD